MFHVKRSEIVDTFEKVRSYCAFVRGVVHRLLEGETRKAVQLILISDVVASRLIEFSGRKTPTQPDLIDLRIGLMRVRQYIRPFAENPYDWISGRMLAKANFYITLIEEEIEHG